MYTLLFDPVPLRSLEKLPAHLKRRILDKIVTTRSDPFRFFQRLHGRSDYKLRIGSYRVIADISIDSAIILITAIGHRRNIYDN